MKFSFLIPVYKTEAYLPRCLDSLLAQTDGDFEAIVVDDASPGNAAADIVARYDSRFTCIRQDRNRSTFQAKATAARHASGDYVVPLDSDDYVLPRLVEELRKVDHLHPDVIVYQMSKVVISKPREGRALSRPRPRQSAALPSWNGCFETASKECGGKVYPVKYNHPAGRCTGAQALQKLFSGRLFMPVCGKAIRRSVFLGAYGGLEVGPDFYLNFTDDLCWLIPILLNAQTVSFIAYDGYRYWRHDDSMTKDVLGDEHMRRLAEQSRRSVETVLAYAKRRGADARTLANIREQLYPTIRWLLRDMHQPRTRLEAVYGPELVDETLRWDAAAGGKLTKLFRHCRRYGLVATLREIRAQLRGEEI